MNYYSGFCTSEAVKHTTDIAGL